MEKVTYSLQIDKNLYDSLKKVTEEDGITLAELLRRGIRWELLIRLINKDDSMNLLVERNGKAQQIVMSR